MIRRVIVCGSRGYADGERIFAELENDRLQHCGSENFYEIVHGACPRGADQFASDYCGYDPFTENTPRRLETRIREERHPADWKTHGKAAGPIRNQAMADAGADLCLAFWDGESHGTLDMITRATKASIPVRVVPK